MNLWERVKLRLKTLSRWIIFPKLLEYFHEIYFLFTLSHLVAYIKMHQKGHSYSEHIHLGWNAGKELLTGHGGSSMGQKW